MIVYAGLYQPTVNDILVDLIVTMSMVLLFVLFVVITAIICYAAGKTNGVQRKVIEKNTSYDNIINRSNDTKYTKSVKLSLVSYMETLKEEKFISWSYKDQKQCIEKKLHHINKIYKNKMSSNMITKISEEIQSKVLIMQNTLLNPKDRKEIHEDALKFVINDIIIKEPMIDFNEAQSLIKKKADSLTKLTVDENNYFILVAEQTILLKEKIKNIELSEDSVTVYNIKNIDIDQTIDIPNVSGNSITQ